MSQGTRSLIVLVSVADLLKLSDETDLDMLNHCMESMVDRFQNELLPVASQLTARLVSVSSLARYDRLITCIQCESYMRLAREGLAQQSEAAPDNIDVDSLISDGEDDKVYGAMGVAKTIGTVRVLSSKCSCRHI